MECHNVIIGYDTAGQPMKDWRCYCGTTACLKKNNLGIVEKINYEKKEDCDCGYETTLTDKGLCRKCEDRFYNGPNGVLRSKLL